MGHVNFTTVMVIPEVGECAGKVWVFLNEEGAKSLDEIKKALDVEEPFFSMALGWLAREAKINFFTKDEVLFVNLSAFHEHYF